MLEPGTLMRDALSLRIRCAVNAAVLAILLGGGGEGGASDTPPSTPAAPNPNINSTTSYRFQNTPAPTDIGTLLNSNSLVGYYFDSRQYVDLDRDGVKEIVVAPGLDSTSGSPVHVFKRQGNGQYTDATGSFFASAVPGQIHPRKLISADFNGDGAADLYFADHGYDHAPFPGAQNVLVLSDQNTGKWVQKSIPGSPTAFHHCASAGDIDNDGTIDIFVCADGYQGPAKSPYFLINDGAGNMIVSRSGVPASLASAGYGMLAAELVDVDRDGYLDLLASHRFDNGTTQTFGTTIFWGEGSGGFSVSRATALPNPDGFVATYDIKAEDIDGDGDLDLILLRVTAALTGYYLQILPQTGTRAFSDESLARIVHDAATWEGSGAEWFPWLHLTDLSGDGALDLAIGDSSGQIPGRRLRWDNDGSGNFTKTCDPVSTPQISVADPVVSEGDSGVTLTTFAVTLSAVSTCPATVNFSSAAGTATAGVDFDSVTGTLSFPVGSTAQTVGVAVHGDRVFEGDESFVLSLSGPLGATLADNQAMGTIANDDSPGFSIDDVSVVEPPGGTTTANFTVTLAPSAGRPTSVDYATANGTAAAPGDYVTRTGTLSFAAGAATQPVSIVVHGDGTKEGIETFLVNLSNATGGQTIGGGQATARVFDAGAFVSLPPCRVADTRGGAPIGGPALAANSVRTFALAGICGIPAGARAVALNLTVTSATGPGDLRVYAAGITPPLASAINYVANQTRANNQIVNLSASGLSVLCDQATGSVNVIIDVAGYFP